jgi:MoaA/NifB/PqqE/SkfB family radical SAM enzyme
MACPFCYCHFTNEPFNKDMCFRIIDKCCDLGVKAITFGGGDPCLCEFIWDLIKYSKNKSIEVHLDTNGLQLYSSKYDFLSENVSLISLPLDGPTADIHGAMRGLSYHFTVVEDHLKRLSTRACRIKINTVVSSINVDYLGDIGELLLQYNITIWSLQHFWPMERGLAHYEDYKLSYKEYEAAVFNLRNKKLPFLLEIGSIAERRFHHFFVTHSGRVFVHCPNHIDNYTELGSFFDPVTIEKWEALKYLSVHPNTLHRYNIKTRKELG